MIRRFAVLSFAGAAALSFGACADASDLFDGLTDLVDVNEGDTGVTDTGTDTGTEETGTDTGTDTGSETGTDTGTEETGTDSGTDAGTDGDTTPLPPCGDGVVGEDETCDDSARVSGCSPGDRCNDTCVACVQATAECGDGSVNGTEVCDASAPASGCAAGRACNESCTACEASSVPACGDGAVNGDEPCDPSAAVDGCDTGFTCNSVCGACIGDVAPSCGDGSVNGTEACDASALPTSGCAAPAVCNDGCTECVTATPGPRCGDGTVNGSETCDGSSVLNSGCTAPERCSGDCSACEIPPRCGDGSRNGAERCDGSAATSGCDTGTICAADCSVCNTIAATCGNGAVDGTETCDGVTAPANGCGPGETCTADCGECQAATCGNGAVDTAEVCDQSATADNGCADDALCAANCQSCNTCGDLEVTGTEECDFDGIFGDIGTCDIATQGCNNCACGPLRLEVVSGSGSTTGIVGTFTAHLVIHDEVDFTNFALLFGDAEGNIVDYFQSGRDVLVQSRFLPEDNPIDYEWRFTVHMLLLPDPDVYDFVYLVLYGADGTASNPVQWDATALFGAPDTGAICDPEEQLPWCISNHSCPAETAVCTDQGEVFSIVSNDAFVDGDAIFFEFTFADDAGDFLPYWSLYATIGEDTFVAFRPYDEEIIDNGDGTYTVSYFIESFEENYGVPLSTVDSVFGVVYDRSSAVVTDEFTLP